MFKFHVTVFYVMGKALLIELSCMWTGLFYISIPVFLNY